MVGFFRFWFLLDLLSAILGCLAFGMQFLGCFLGNDFTKEGSSMFFYVVSAQILRRLLCWSRWEFNRMEGIVVRRVIPSDNSCLFNAVGWVSFWNYGVISWQVSRGLF